MKQILTNNQIFILLLIISLFLLGSIQAQESSNNIKKLNYVRVYADSLGE